MTSLLDTSVVLASLDPDEPRHTECDRLLSAGRHLLFAHGLAECFSILTGGRSGRRLRPAAVAALFEESILPFVETVHLTGRETLMALRECDGRGVRGGAVYDFLHLFAARKAGATRVVTLDLSDYRAIARPGDPRIETP